MLKTTFDEVLCSIVELERAWQCELELSALRRTWRDVIHHMCGILAELDGPDAASTFDDLSDVQRMLAHEAHRAVLEIGELVQRAIIENHAPRPQTARAEAAVSAMLDALDPYVSRSDDALRRMVLENEPFEAALARIQRAG